jgi:hypothetical protein
MLNTYEGLRGTVKWLKRAHPLGQSEEAIGSRTVDFDTLLVRALRFAQVLHRILRFSIK